MHCEPLDSISWTLAEYEKDMETFTERLNNMQDWSQIPAINDVPLDSMTDGSLIRYQGMVQDNFNPEYYTNYRVKDKKTGEVTVRSGRMRDLLFCAESEELQMDEDLSSQEVRYPLFCIPIPGLNDWAKNFSKSEKPTPCSRSSGQKRCLDDSVDVEMKEETKHMRTEDPVLPGVKPNAPTYNLDINKFFPLPELGGFACIVKHYGNDEDILVNARIEAVGFLSLDPALEAHWADCDAEDRTMHPPPSLVPRLHAVVVRKLSHCNPALPLSFESVEMDCMEIRRNLEKILTIIFFGDNLAADYVICNLISTVYARNEGLALGALSLNIYNLNVPNFPNLFYKFLETILPNNVYLPLTIDLLNNTSFVPVKDYEANKLLSGRLQLPDDTHILVDETKMTSGTLQDRGVRNMAALHTLALQQEVKYEFNYFLLPYHTNLPVLVLSEGKSMIPTDAPLKLQPELNHRLDVNETFKAAGFFMSGARLSAVRNYLSALRLKQCDMSNIEFVGQAWANLRQQNVHLKPSDLHRLLVISRLIALSYGRGILTKDDWDKAVAMEMDRQCRART